MQGCVYEMSRDAYEALWRSEGGAMKKTPYQEVVVSVRDAVDATSTRSRARSASRGVDKQVVVPSTTASRPHGTSASSRRARARDGSD